MFSPDAFFPVLEKLTAILQRYGVRFHLTGGLVAVYYAEPRLTADADIVVDPVQLRQQIDGVVESLKAEDYLLDETTLRDCIRRGRLFQVIDMEESLKVDLYPRELVPGELDRSQWVPLTPSLRMPVASRPDLVVAKLVWITKGSHKSRRDVRQILLRATDDEQRTVREFAETMSLTNVLDEVLAESDEIDG